MLEPEVAQQGFGVCRRSAASRHPLYKALEHLQIWYPAGVGPGINPWQRQGMTVNLNYYHFNMLSI